MNLKDLYKNVTNLVTSIFEDSVDPTGFNREDLTSLPVMELCEDSSSESYRRINQDGTYEEIDSTTTFGDGITELTDYTLCVRPLNESFYFYFQGKKHIITSSLTYQLNDSIGSHLIAFDKTNTLVEATSTRDAIVNKVLCTVLYQDSDRNYWLFADEKHGKDKNSYDHLQEHETIGCQYQEGLDIHGLVVDTNSYDFTSSGIARDEDIEMIIQNQSVHPFIYRDDTNIWKQTSASNVLQFDYNSGIAWNNIDDDGKWFLEEVPENYYTTTHFLLTNDSKYPIVKIIGHAIYSSIEEARGGIVEEVKNLKLEGLPSPELLFIYSVIIDYEGNLQIGNDGSYKYDFRETRYDFVDKSFSIPIITTGELATIPIEGNKMFYHKEMKKYIVSDPIEGKFKYLAFGSNFMAPGPAGTFTEDWSDDYDTLVERWSSDQMSSSKKVEAGKWSFEKDATASSNTGPSAPQSGSYYIYTEGSSDGYKEDFILETVYFADLTEIDFYYHAYGSEVGHVSLDYRVGDTWTEIWSIDGDQGDKWINQVCDFTDLGVEAIRFRQHDATGYKCDVAFDTIKITSV